MKKFSGCLFVHFRPLSSLQTKWFKVGSQRTEILANNKYIYNSAYKRVLTIKDPDLNDAGQYECEAVFINNGQTDTKTAAAYLTVHGKESCLLINKCHIWQV